MNTSINRACAVVGSQAELARRVGVTVQAVNKWCRKGRVPAERVLAVEVATGGEVARHEMRPDIYPPLEAKPEAAA